ncbi:MAG TPA: transposase family protein, partial [Candidatus Angelobacter sp.]
NTSVGLLSERQELVELPLAAFESLVQQNRIETMRIGARHGVDSGAADCISKASERDLQIANRRAEFINRYFCSGTIPASTEVPTRTFYRWLNSYREAEARYHSGFVGLLPGHGRQGNPTPKLPETSRRRMLEVIEEDYETLKQKTRYASWIKLKLSCEGQGIQVPSYKTFCTAVGQQSGYNQEVKRKGRRAGYKLETFYWQLDQMTPRHGDRPFEIAHIDHTQLDVECLSHAGHVLGRPWMTLLTDAFSRRVLAFYLTFDPPSYRSCMMILRECVRRFCRFPQILVVDGGREFQSTYFETLLARYECTKKTRPAAKARFGATCERMFGVTNTQFIHNLRGNTQITRNVRVVTKTVDPKGLATWPLEELHQRLSEYFYVVYDGLQHPALGTSPEDCFQMGLMTGGIRLNRMVSYSDEFLMLILPTTVKGTGKVLATKGIKINQIYYWCEAFRDPEIQGKRFAVRYDPFDAGTAYVFTHKQWVQCHSEYYAVLKGRSEREIMLATKELHQKHRHHVARFTVTARRLAEFLQSVEAEETLLIQRICDQESRAIRNVALVNEAEDITLADNRSAPDDDISPKSAPEDLRTGEIYGEF